MPRNLLIGTITNYSWDDVAMFCNSYVQTGFENCDCVLFIDNISDKTIRLIQSCGIIVHNIDERFKGCSVNGFRWSLYRDYLNEHKGEYDMICTCDVRDLVFQRDIFKCYKDHAPFLGLALEDVSLSTDWSRNYITYFFGREVWESVKEQRTICMGTVWGTADKFYEFARRIAYHIVPGIYRHSLSDQNIANVLIYRDKILNDITIVTSDNYAGCVMTVASRDKCLKQDSEGNILNDKGEVAAIVHQYDRKPELIELFMKKYSGNATPFLKILLRHEEDKQNFGKRVARFMSKVYWNGLMKTIIAAVKRRI